MAEPRQPRPALTNDDAGFPPLREIDEETKPDDDDDDFDRDFHEEGGGD